MKKEFCYLIFHLNHSKINLEEDIASFLSNCEINQKTFFKSKKENDLFFKTNQLKTIENKQSNFYWHCNNFYLFKVDKSIIILFSDLLRSFIDDLLKKKNNDCDIFYRHFFGNFNTILATFDSIPNYQQKYLNFLNKSSKTHSLYDEFVFFGKPLHLTFIKEITHVLSNIYFSKSQNHLVDFIKFEEYISNIYFYILKFCQHNLFQENTHTLAANYLKLEPQSSFNLLFYTKVIDKISLSENLFSLNPKEDIIKKLKKKYKKYKIPNIVIKNNYSLEIKKHPFLKKSFEHNNKTFKGTLEDKILHHLLDILELRFQHYNFNELLKFVEHLNLFSNSSFSIEYANKKIKNYFSKDLTKH